MAPQGFREARSRWTPGRQISHRVMAETASIRAAITIIGDELDPDEITRLVECAPSRSRHRGDRVGSRSSSTHRHGLWSLTTDGSVDEARPLHGHVAWLMERTTANTDVWRELASRYTCRVFVGWFMDQENEGVILPPELLGEMAARHPRLQLDVYAMTEAPMST